MVRVTTSLRLLLVSSLFLLGHCRPQDVPASTAAITTPTPAPTGPVNSTLIASATNAAHALSTAVVDYKTTPDKEHADAAKKAADDAKAAAGAVGAISSGFAALIASLESVSTAAEAAVANPGAETAAELEETQKKVDESEEEVEKEQSSSQNPTQNPTSASVSSSTMATTAGPPVTEDYPAVRNKGKADALATSILSSEEAAYGCMAAFTLPWPSACKPICDEGNNEKMGMNNEPDKWCFCGGRGPFSTISGKNENYCDFDTLPTETISLTSHSTSINTACVTTSTVTAPGATPDSYCQCGNVMAGYRTDTSVVDRTTYKYTACALETPFTFATETITPTPVATPLCGNYCLSFGTDNQPRAFSRDQGKDAIEKFCGLQNGAGDNFPSAQDYSIKASDPKAGSSRERFWYDRDTGGFCYSQSGRTGSGYWGPGPNCPHALVNLWITIMFQRSANQDGCAPAGDWKFPQKDKCMDTLMPLLDNCNTDTTTNKWGGSWRLKTQAGCFDMTLFGVDPYRWHDAANFPDGKPDASNQIEL